MHPTTLAAPYFVRWGVVQISLGNLLVVVSMIVLFALALFLPFPGHRDRDDRSGR